MGYSPWVEKRHDWVSTHTYPLFLLFIVSFTMQNLLSLSKSHLFLFPLFWEEKGLAAICIRESSAYVFL